MADPEHVNVVRQGGMAIVMWRISHPTTKLDLSHADLRGWDLRTASLEWCNLRGTNLTGALLKGTKLNGADLTGAIVSQDQLASAQSTEGAKLDVIDPDATDTTRISRTDLAQASPTPQAFSITAIVMSFPPNLRRPQPGAGESVATFVIRHQADEWRDMLQFLQRELGVSAEVCSQLDKPGQLEMVTDPRAQKEIQDFMNMRLPAHWRTVKCLAELKTGLRNKASNMFGPPLDLVQILCPRERPPDGNTAFVREFQDLGAEVFFIETGLTRAVDFADHLPRVRGEFLWTISGATKFSARRVAMALGRVVGFFAREPRLAMYSDAAYSALYRIAALQELSDNGHTLGYDTGQHARLLRDAGYLLAQDSDAKFALSELEPFYGGA